MPSLKSSSKGGDTIALFATERRALKSAIKTLEWLGDRTGDKELKAACTEGVRQIGSVLLNMPEPERAAK